MTHKPNKYDSFVFQYKNMIITCLQLLYGIKKHKLHYSTFIEIFVLKTPKTPPSYSTISFGTEQRLNWTLLSHNL